MIHRRLHGLAFFAALLVSFAPAAHAAGRADRGASMYLSAVEAPRFGDTVAAAREDLASAGHGLARFAHLEGVAAVDAAARRNGVPIALARAVMRVESGGNCRARSYAGAVGVMQLLPATARSLGVYGALTDCGNSAEAGARYLAKLIAAHGVSCASLSLYERGLAARPVCTAYGRKVVAQL